MCMCVCVCLCLCVGIRVVGCACVCDMFIQLRIHTCAHTQKYVLEGYVHVHMRKSTKKNLTKQGVCVVCACMCVLCVRDMYIQQYRHVPEHTHI